MPCSEVTASHASAGGTSSSASIPPRWSTPVPSPMSRSSASARTSRLETALSLAEAFDRERPELCVVLLAEPTADALGRRLRAGVRDVVSGRCRRREPARCAAPGHRAHRTPAGHAGPGRAGRAAGGHRRVITVLSPKGGTGKTTIASNLAIGLGRIHPGRVVLVDLDVQFGDVATVLGLTPEHSLADVAKAPIEPRRHHAEGLPHPPRLGDLRPVRSEHPGRGRRHHRGPRRQRHRAAPLGVRLRRRRHRRRPRRGLPGRHRAFDRPGVRRLDRCGRRAQRAQGDRRARPPGPRDQPSAISC